MSNIQIEAVEFIGKFLSVPEGSSMYFMNSVEYVQALCLMLGETKYDDSLREMKEETSKEIGIPIYIVETDVFRWQGFPTHKIDYQYKSGRVKRFDVDVLLKELKLVRSNLFTIVTVLINRYKLKFPMQIDTTIKQKALRRDFSKARKPFEG